MYKYLDQLQHSFLDFNQPLGMHMNPENRWVRLAEQIPWDIFESKYADLFPNDMVYLLNRLLECFLIMIELNYMMKRIVKLKIVMIR